MTATHAPIPLIIFGTGGNSFEIVDTIHAINASSPGQPRYVCMGYLDDDRSRWGWMREGLPVLGPISSAGGFAAQFVNGIGGPTNYWIRPDVVARANVPIDRFETLIHPTASVASTARLGRGVVIFSHVTVGSHATIADHALVLPNSVVSHDASVGEHTCIAAGVCLSGGVEVEPCCYLGSRSCVIGSAHIGEGALVGMGSVVLDDVACATVVVGNPARLLRHARAAITA